MIFLSGLISLDYWLNGSHRDYKESYLYVDHNNCADFDIGKEDLNTFAQENGFELPLQVMIPRGKRRKNTLLLAYKQMPSFLPAGSFVTVSKGVCVATPECCVLLTAGSTPLAMMIKIINDLCANYVFDDRMEFKQRFRNPLTSRNKIMSYLDRAKGVGGVKKAKCAVQYASDNSNSPMETVLGLLCSLPLMHGGYAAGKPELNLNVKLSEEGKKLFGRDTCCCDCCWSKEKVVAEYDSTMVHLDLDQLFWDKKKSSALAVSGYKVINVSSKNFKSFENIEYLFIIIRKSLGIPMRRKSWNKYRDKRKDVLKQLLKH